MLGATTEWPMFWSIVIYQQPRMQIDRQCTQSSPHPLAHPKIGCFCLVVSCSVSSYNSFWLFFAFWPWDNDCQEQSKPNMASLANLSQSSQTLCSSNTTMSQTTRYRSLKGLGWESYDMSESTDGHLIVQSFMPSSLSSRLWDTSQA